MPGGDPLFTRGFRRLLDMVLALLGVGVAVSWRGPEGIVGDLGFSIALFFSGAAAGVPLWVLATSAPVYPVALALESMGVPVHWAPVIVALLRVARAAWVAWSLEREAGVLGGAIDRALVQAGLLAAFTLIVGGFTFYLVERGVPGSSVDSVWDGLWLALVTMTTVGYGDMVPVTAHGRLVAGIVMLVGIGVFTFFLSSLAVGLSRVMVEGGVLTPFEKKKKTLAEMVRNLESLSDEEFNALIEDLKTMYLLATADRRMLDVDLTPSTLLHGREEATA